MSRRVIKEIEAMVLGPEDRLLIRLPDDIGIDDQMLDLFIDSLAKIGIGERTVVIVGEAEFVKLTPD